MVKSPEILYTKITLKYGLASLCELSITRVPGPGSHDEVVYRSDDCRKFPLGVKDKCDSENQAFCAEWTSAGYIDQIAIGFGAVSLITILFGVSTHSRRRRIWRAVAWLTFFQGAQVPRFPETRFHCWATVTALCQLTAFSIIAHNHETRDIFALAHPGEWLLSPLYASWWHTFLSGVGYVLNILSWVFGLLIAAGVIVTGLAADNGYRWAAGNRTYRPIPEGR